MKLIKILIVLVFGYVFYADLLIALTHFNFVKIFFAGLIFLFFCLNIILNNKILKQKKIMVYASMIMLFYLLMWGGMGKLNLLYTIIFGWILFQNPSFTFKCLFFLFITQFVCILYESLSGHFLYTEITSGTFNQNEYDYSGVMDYFSDTGFRPKGLFPGTLIGASFIIYYSLLMRNNLLMMFWIFIMAYLLNGRMAMIVSFVTFSLCLINQINISHYKRNLSLGLKCVLGVFCIFILGIILYHSMSSVRLDHILSIFDTDNTNNAGRVFRYIEGLITYFSDYNVKDKLFGKTDYELYDLYGRSIPPESEIVGMLLEIGLAGLFLYLYALKKLWQKEKVVFVNFHSTYLNLKYVVFWTFVCMLQYRHVAGNQRGTLFWFVFCDNKKELNCYFLKDSHT